MTAAIAHFQRLADERSAKLSTLTFAELVRHAADPETVKVGGRTGSLCTYVEHREDGTLRVVVHGLLRFKWIPFMNSVAVQGFYKHPDDTISPIPEYEYNEVD